MSDFGLPLAVIPVLAGPLQALIPILWGVLVAAVVSFLSLFRPQVMWAIAKVLWRQKVQVIGVVAVIVGLVWAGQWLAAALAPKAGLSEGSGDWTVARGTSARLGSPDGRGPNAGGVNWELRNKGEAFFSSPAVVGNRVYVASANFGPFGDSGLIYCLDADTGAQAWAKAPRGYRATFSSPVIAGDYLLIGEGLHKTADARINCLSLKPGEEGKVLWSHRTTSHVESTPHVWKDRVIVNAGDDGTYCLALEGDGNGGSKELWHLRGKEFPDCETSLAVYEGRVYLGLGNEGNGLCVIDAENGEVIKRLKMPYPVFGPPSIADGKLYVGMGNGDYINDAEKVRAERLKTAKEAGKSAAELAELSKSLAPGGEVRCIDLKTLETDWSFQMKDTVLGCVAVTPERLYFCGRDGWVYSLTRGGKLADKWNSNAPILASPAVAGDRVYVVNTAGMLYMLDAETLEPRWEYRLGFPKEDAHFVGSPVAARGKIYVGTPDGFVCVGEQSDIRPVARWLAPLGGPGRVGNPLSARLPEVGTLHWQYPADQTGENQEARVQAAPAMAGGSAYVPLAVGPTLGVVCLPTDSTAEETPKPRWIANTANGVSVSPVLVDEQLYVVDGKPGDQKRSLTSLTCKGGLKLWQQPVDDRASGQLAATLEGLYVQDKPAMVTSRGLGGEERWSRPVGELAGPVTVDDLVVLGATRGPAELFLLDRLTGQELWRQSLPGEVCSAPIMDRGVIYLGTTAGFEARELASGARLEGWPVAPPVSAEVAMTASQFIYISVDGKLVIFDREKGTVARELTGATPGVPPLLDRNAVYYFGKDGLMRLSLDSDKAEPVQWMDTSWLGKVTAAAVVEDGNVYIGMAGWGLVRLGKGRGN